MPVLSDINKEKLCVLNQDLLIEHSLVDQNGYINVGGLSLQDQKELINKLLVNEKNNKESYVKNYQKDKNKGEYILQLMTAFVIILGATYALAPLFIASSIMLPILPFLLLGFAIIAITKFILTIKNNSLETHAEEAVNILNELKEIDLNVEREIINNSNNEIKEMKRIAIATNEQTENVSEKIDAIEEKISQILTKLGMFPMAPMSIPPADPANEFHNHEAMSHSKT